MLRRYDVVQSFEDSGCNASAPLKPRWGERSDIQLPIALCTWSKLSVIVASPSRDPCVGLKVGVPGKFHRSVEYRTARFACYYCTVLYFLRLTSALQLCRSPFLPGQDSGESIVSPPPLLGAISKRLLGAHIFDGIDDGITFVFAGA